jgi:pyruvate dehydrogenase (quinone)
VHHKLPVKVVIYNNSAFGLITLEAESVGLPPIREGIEFPNPDFAALARACGGHGFTARQPGELKAAVAEAFAIDGPAIVDAVSFQMSCRTCRTSTWIWSSTSLWQRSRKPFSP